MNSKAEETVEKESASRPQVGGVLVTHGRLAHELLAAAEMIVGAVHHIAAVSIGWHDDTDVAHTEIEHAINRVSQGHGVLLLTDMFGGTPTNIAAMFLTDATVEVVTGVNLPMVIKVATQNSGGTLEEVARHVRDGGKQGIYLAGELLAPNRKS